jgi:hypothetical protein
MCSDLGSTMDQLKNIKLKELVNLNSLTGEHTLVNSNVVVLMALANSCTKMESNLQVNGVKTKNMELESQYLQMDRQKKVSTKTVKKKVHLHIRILTVHPIQENHPMVITQRVTHLKQKNKSEIILIITTHFNLL